MYFQIIFIVSLSHRQDSLLNIQILDPRGWKTPHGACLVPKAQLFSVNAALLLSELSGIAVTPPLSGSSPLHRVSMGLVSDSKVLTLVLLDLNRQSLPLRWPILLSVKTTSRLCSFSSI